MYTNPTQPNPTQPNPTRAKRSWNAALKLILGVLIGLFVLTSFKAHSQGSYSCLVDETVEPFSQCPPDEFCSDYLKYIPTPSDPELKVKLNFHFISRPEPLSPLNFTATSDGVDPLNGYTGYMFAQEVIDMVNARQMQNTQMYLPPGNSTAVLDRKFSYVLAGVYFHTSANHWNSTNNPVLLNLYGANQGEEINIFFPSHNILGEGITGGMANMLGCSDRVCHIRGVWDHYAQGLSAHPDFLWMVAYQVLHETGHNLRLPHTMMDSDGDCDVTQDDDFADTPTIPQILGMGLPYPCCGSSVVDPTCSNNLMDYSGVHAITPEQLGKVHSVLHNEFINYLERDFCEVDETQNITISNGVDETWDRVRILRGNLRIASGGKLTMKCTTYMPIEANIIVENGGQLIIDGGTISTLCDGLWSGIEVWGDADAPQTPSNQGRLIANGGTIQDAHTAVWVRANDDVCNYVEGSGGGIVQLTNTTIRNCYIGVEFAPYRRVLSNGVVVSNTSYFNGVVFEQTRPLLGGFLFKSHAILEDVVKIPFRGCTFIDYVANEPEYMSLYGVNGGEMGVGIDSRSASFMLQPWCTGMLSLAGDCVNGTWVEPTFTNLRYGVLAGSFFTHEPFSVRGALFTDNLVGIKAYGDNIGPSIVQNTFHVSPRAVSSLPGALSDASVGVLMRTVNGFELEENEFIGNPSALYPNLRVIGAAFFNTLPADATPDDTEYNNECYKNNFDHLDAGVLALGKNGGFSGGQLPGLQFECNTFGENDANSYGDIVVGDNSAIKSNQGANQADKQAGNLFSHLCPNGGEPSDIVMGVNAMGITYWYGTDDTREEPICYTLGLVNPVPVQGQNPCPSKLSKDLDKTVLADEMDQVNGILIDTKNLYMGLLDCGDRQEALDAINNPQLSSMEVRNAMLNCSPYISDAVFTAAFNRIPAMSSWHLAQVLLANSPLSPRVKQQAIDAGLEPYYLQLVLNGQNGGPTHKTILESDIAYLQGALSRMRQDYLRLTLLWDEDEADWGDAVNRLVTDSANAAILIGGLINKGDLAQADALLQTLPKTRDADKAVHAILEARIDGDHCPRYTPQQLSLLQSVAVDLDSDASALAYAALMPITGEVVDIPLPFPSSKGLAQSEQLNLHTIPFLKVFPNPTSDVVNLLFNAPDPDTRCRFVLEDNQGQRVLELNDVRNGMAEFSVNRLPGGLYIGRLIFDNTVIATEKITVVR